MNRDRFGNELASGLPYARGEILGSTEDDLRKLERAWHIIARRGAGAVFNFSGLERSLPAAPEDLAYADDELAPALYLGRLTALALDHLGGAAPVHDAALFNRLTAATFATHLTLVRPGDTVVGISPTYSHPTIARAAAQVGAKFIDTREMTLFAEVLEREHPIPLVVVTRLAVTYDLMPVEALRTAIRLAHERGALAYMDDAGGARVGPAIFSQPRTLELGADLGATGLDKYGVSGPRLGLLAGEKTLVGGIRARAFEFGLEARPMLYPAAVRSLVGYAPEKVQALVESTRRVGTALRARLGPRVRETSVTAQLRSDDILEIAMERAGLTEPSIVPYEAKAALAMLLLDDYGILTVHFAGIPPGTPSLLFKFVPPDILAAFGGPEAFANAVDASLTKLAALIQDPRRVRELLLGC
jgi:L-seryl-tRNA(Ser) seleniumtransferase